MSLLRHVILRVLTPRELVEIARIRAGTKILRVFLQSVIQKFEGAL